MMRRMAIAAIALAGVFGHLACGLGSCERVNTSRWATFLGLPVAAWGVGFYVVTFVVALWGTSAAWGARREPAVVLTLLTGVGLVFSAWLTYLELYVIGAVCRFCVGSALLVLLLFALSIADLRATRRAAPGIATPA
jgi:uncharacterized membrane protein